MTLICISHIPTFWNINRFRTLLAKNIPGKYEVLKFSFPNRKSKNAYVKLSEKTNSLSFLNDLIKLGQKIKVKLTGRVVDNIPENVPLSKSIQKMTQLDKKKRAALPPEKVLFLTHHEILVELQSKYTGLLLLSKNCDHELFIKIAKTVFERLRHIINTNLENAKAPFVLSKAYRKSYPHFGDFQLILSTLHAIEDAAGRPRTQVAEHELAKPPKPPGDMNEGEFNNEKVKFIVHKYIDKIEQKIKDYVVGLKTDIDPETATPEELAQHRVRVQLKKVGPFMEPILRQVMTIHFHGAKRPLTPNHYLRMRIYGEPFLPTRDHIEPIMNKCKAIKIIRSDNIYNMVAFNTRYLNYAYLMGLNGKEVGGAKLVIRPFRGEKIKMPPLLRKELEGLINASYDIPEEQQMEVWDEEM